MGTLVLVKDLGVLDTSTGYFVTSWHDSYTVMMYFSSQSRQTLRLFPTISAPLALLDKVFIVYSLADVTETTFIVPY